MKKIFIYVLAFLVGSAVGDLFLSKAFAQSQIYPIPQVGSTEGGSGTTDFTSNVWFDAGLPKMMYRTSNTSSSAGQSIALYVLFNRELSAKTFYFDYDVDVVTGGCSVGMVYSSIGSAPSTNSSSFSDSNIGTSGSFGTYTSDIVGATSTVTTSGTQGGVGIRVYGASGYTDSDCIVTLNSIQYELYPGVMVDVFTILDQKPSGTLLQTSTSTGGGGSSALSDEQFDGIMWLLSMVIAIMFITSVIGLFYKK